MGALACAPGDKTAAQSPPSAASAPAASTLAPPAKAPDPTPATPEAPGPSAQARRDAAARSHAAIQTRQLGGPLPPSEHVRSIELEHPEALSAFAAALERLESGDGDKLRIAVWGASSVAGDRWTGYLRGYLQHRFGDGGPGFVAAVPLWRWHRHQEVDLDASGPWVVTHSLRPKGRADGLYGLMGVRATGRYAGTRVTLSLDGARARPEQWSLWLLDDPRGGSITAQLDDAEPMRVETRGESRPRYVELSHDHPHAKLSLSVAADGPVHLFGAVIENASPGVVVDELGIGGSGARRVLHWNEALWVEHLARRNPALVVFAYGGIEAMRKEHDPERFAREWRDILARVRRAVPDASCLLVAPQDLALRKGAKYRRRPDTMDSILEVIRTTAAEEGCAHFDTPAMMGGAGSMRTWVKAGLAMKDHVHFTKAGYAHLGRVLADALMAASSR